MSRAYHATVVDLGSSLLGKSATLLNYYGIRTDLIEHTVDRNPDKHGRYTTGTHIPIHLPERIPIHLPERIAETRPHCIAEWGARLTVPIPFATVIEPGTGAVDCLETARRAA